MLTVFGAPALAGEERYDYDALGRLVRVIDEQGRVTEYVYDAAGNILQVIVSGAGSAQPPVVTSSSVTSIRRGETKAFQITGTGLIGAHVHTPDPGLDISGLQVSATQISFSLTATAAAALGAHILSIANAGGATSVQLTVNPVLPKLNMAPLPIAVPPTGTGRQFFVTLSSPDSIDHVVSLASSNPARMTVSPASVTFTAGQTERLVTVTGLTVGNAAINLSSPLLAPTSVPVFVTAEFAGITTSFAPLVQVIKEQAPGGTSTTFGPFASAFVGVAKGAYISGVAPSRFGVGTGPTNLVITGAGLANVTGVTIIPNTGVTLGGISAATDGTSVTIPVTVAANAPATARTIRLSGASQPYIAARPGADQFFVTLPPPQIDSVEPIFATTGTTAATLTIRGRNLQSPEAVTFTPGTGITVSATPVASADGTSLTVAYTVAPLAPTGTHAVRAHTLGGISDGTPTPANTFSVVSEVVSTVTPIASAHVGVVREDPAPPPPQILSAYALHVGVIVPPAATGLSPAVGIVGTDVTLTITGAGLAGVTAVQMVPADGVTIGTPSANPDGSSVTVSIGIALTASQQLREVRLFAGSAPVIFSNAAAALFRVSAPLPVFDSVTPIVLQVGAPAVTLTIAGRNFLNASAVRIEPGSHITVSPPTVNGSTQVSFTVSAAAGAATGPRAVVLTTPAGDSPLVLSEANTLTLVNTIQGAVTPIAAAALGVVLETTAPPPTQTFGPFVSPDVGVVVEAAPPAPPQATTRALQLGIAVGPFASGVQVPPLTPTSTGTLVVSGVGLTDVTALQIVPATGITVGGLTIAPDGTQVSALLTLSGAAAGTRGVRVLRGSQRVEFVPAGTHTFRVGVGVPHIDSITPILESRDRTFTLLIRGQNFQDVTAVTAEPPAGLIFDAVATPNAGGTEVTVRITVTPDAPLGARVIRVFTPGGATTDVAEPANTFTVLE